VKHGSDVYVHARMDLRYGRQLFRRHPASIFVWNLGVPNFWPNFLNNAHLTVWQSLVAIGRWTSEIMRRKKRSKKRQQWNNVRSLLSKKAAIMIEYWSTRPTIPFPVTDRNCSQSLQFIQPTSCTVPVHWLAYIQYGHCNPHPDLQTHFPIYCKYKFFGRGEWMYVLLCIRSRLNCTFSSLCTKTVCRTTLSKPLYRPYRLGRWLPQCHSPILRTSISSASRSQHLRLSRQHLLLWKYVSLLMVPVKTQKDQNSYWFWK